MKIVAVDNVSQRLKELEKTIRKVFPDDMVSPFTDPMLAAKYGVRHNVDIIIAERKMPRMDGFEMVDVIQRFNRNIKIYLIKEPHESLDGMNDAGVAGWLNRPVIEETLREITTPKPIENGKLSGGNPHD